MAISQYTLTDLYNKGLIDYVPSDLCYTPAMTTMSPAVNPYLSMAQTGNLYQKYGSSGDTFSTQAIGNNNNRWAGWAYNTTETGSQSNNFQNMFGFDGTGSQYMGDAGQNTGSLNQMTVASMHGGFGDVKRNLSEGVDKLSSIPKAVVNIASAIILFGTGYLLLRRGKKPKVPQEAKTGFNWSKLNPLNWFRKSKTK